MICLCENAQLLWGEGQNGWVTSEQTKLAETTVAKANVIAKKSTLTKKVALTKKLEQTEKKQIIVTQGQTKRRLHSLREISYQYNRIFVHGGRCIELVDSNIVSTAHSAILITILLEKLIFGYDDFRVHDLDASNGPQGVVVNLVKKPAGTERSLIQREQDE